MIARFICLVFICSHFITSNEGSKILGIFPMAAPSHYFLANSLLKGLAEAGHDVTMVSPFSDKSPPKRGTYREIILEDLAAELQKHLNKTSLLDMNKSHGIFSMLFGLKMSNSMTEKTLANPKVQKLIHSDEKFDVLIVGQFGSDAFKALANHFSAHLVQFSNTASNSVLNRLVGNPSLPSFHPEHLLGFSKHMSFFQRMENMLFNLFGTTLIHVYLYPHQNQLIQKYIPNPVDINDVLYNTSLVLLNSHVSLFYPQPSVPCMVEIGGFHIKPPKKLPEDLKKFLDEATEGVIYFSMGSNLKSTDLPAKTRDAILKTFSKRKERILWKWEDDVLPGQPSNVKLGKWLPQQDILAHPNVKVFITHGGLLSTTETIYHGVPIIAIPIFADQHMNAKIAAEGGFCLVLPYKELSEEKLSSLLDEILTNPKYRDNAQTRSRIMADRQVKPLDNAVYWVEYVIRHNGATHLRVPYLDLTWYQYYLLDVLGFIFIVTFAVIILLKTLFSYLCCRKTVKKVKKN